MDKLAGMMLAFPTSRPCPETERGKHIIHPSHSFQTGTSRASDERESIEGEGGECPLQNGNE